MKERKAPEIRFEGFTDDWEQRKLGDCFLPLQNNTLSRADLSDENGVVMNVHYGDVLIKFEECLDVSKERLPFVKKQSVADKFATSYLKNGDVIVADTAEDETVGKCTEIIGLTDQKVISGLHTIPLRPNGQFATGYLGFYMNSAAYHTQLKPLMQGIKVTSISKSAMQDTVIKYPSDVKEQALIGQYFMNLDHLITLHQRECERLQIVKKSMLENMFPKNGERVPKIRFSGFTDDWEQRKLSDEFSDFIVPMRDKPKEFGGNIPWTRIEDIEGKYLNGTLSDQYVTEETVKKMNLKIIPRDSLIVSSSATFGVVAVVTRDLITNQTFIGLVPNEKETLDYWYAYFYSYEARKYMKLQSAGSTIFYISRESFENMPIAVPSKAEMMKIGACFDNLDNLITIHQRELDKLVNIKKSMLVKMFV